MTILAELFRIILIALLFTALLGPGSPAGAESFDATNLVTDDQTAHSAQITDPALKNAWRSPIPRTEVPSGFPPSTGSGP